MTINGVLDFLRDHQTLAVQKTKKKFMTLIIGIWSFGIDLKFGFWNLKFIVYFIQHGNS